MYTLVRFKQICVYKWCLHSKRLSNQQQKVEQVNVQHTVIRHTLGQKLIRHLVSWPLSQISACQMDPAISLFFSCQFLLLLFQFTTPLFPCLVLCFNLCLSLSLSPCQTYGNVTLWSWCWRSLYPRSLTVSVTCCCARLGFYWACSTATS